MSKHPEDVGGASAGAPAVADVGRSISAAGIYTNYHDVGSGPPVLLLHGSGPGVTAWANWRGTIAQLSPEFRVVAPDLAGFGYSPMPVDTQWDLRLWVGQIRGLLDALALERVSVVGNSFGGALALALAVECGERIDRLVLMGSAGLDFELTAGLDAVWGYQPGLENMRELMTRWFAYDPALIRDDLVELRYRAALRPGVQEAFAAMFPPPRQESIRRLAQPEALLARLPHPCLIVHGRDDRVIPLESSLRLHRLIAQSELHVFGQCGHWVQIEKAARFCAVVAGFLRS